MKINNNNTNMIVCNIKALLSDTKRSKLKKKVKEKNEGVGQPFLKW